MAEDVNTALTILEQAMDFEQGGHEFYLKAGDSFLRSGRDLHHGEEPVSGTY